MVGSFCLYPRWSLCAPQIRCYSLPRPALRFDRPFPQLLFEPNKSFTTRRHLSRGRIFSFTTTNTSTPTAHAVAENSSPRRFEEDTSEYETLNEDDREAFFSTWEDETLGNLCPEWPAHPPERVHLSHVPNTDTQHASSTCASQASRWTTSMDVPVGMAVEQAKTQLARYTARVRGGLLPNPMQLPAAERERVRAALDCLIQTPTPARWVGLHEALRVAFASGFPERCTELYAAVLREIVRAEEEEQRPETGEGLSFGQSSNSSNSGRDSGGGPPRAVVLGVAQLPSVVLAAVARTQCWEVLGLALRLTEALASKARDSAIVPALRLYAGVWPLLQPHCEGRSGPSKIPPNDEAEAVLNSPADSTERPPKFHELLRDFAKRALGVLDVVTVAEQESFLLTSERLVRYQGWDMVQTSAVVYFQLFRAYTQKIQQAAGDAAAAVTSATPAQGLVGVSASTSTEASRPLSAHSEVELRSKATVTSSSWACSTWLTPRVLYELLGSALEAGRRDLTEFYLLYSDALFAHQSKRNEHAENGEGEGEKKEDGIRNPPQEDKAGVVLDTEADGLLARTLQCFLRAHEPTRGVRWFHAHQRRHQTRRGEALGKAGGVVLPGLRGCLAVLRLATATEDAALARWAFEALLHEAQPVPAGPDALAFALGALARLGIPAVGRITAALHTHGVLTLTPEATVQLRLWACQRNGGVGTPAEAALRALLTRFLPLSGGASLFEELAHVPDPDGVLSIRNLDLLLRLLHHREDAELAKAHRLLLRRRGVRLLLGRHGRARWVERGLSWAIARADRLRPADLHEFARETRLLLQTPSSRADAPRTPPTLRRVRRGWAYLASCFAPSRWRELVGKAGLLKEPRAFAAPSGVAEEKITPMAPAEAAGVGETVLDGPSDAWVFFLAPFQVTTPPFVRFLTAPRHGMWLERNATALFDQTTAAIVCADESSAMEGKKPLCALAFQRERWRSYQTD